MVAARAVYRAIARVLVFDMVVVVAGLVSDVGHTGLQAQQVWNVTSVQRNLFDLLFSERVSKRGVYQIQGRGFASDRNAL